MMLNTEVCSWKTSIQCRSFEWDFGIQDTHHLEFWNADCNSWNSYKVIDSSFPSSSSTYVSLTSITKLIGLILYTSRSHTKILDDEYFEIQYDDIYQQGICKPPVKFPIALFVHVAFACASELGLVTYRELQDRGVPWRHPHFWSSLVV